MLRFCWDYMKIKSRYDGTQEIMEIEKYYDKPRKETYTYYFYEEADGYLGCIHENDVLEIIEDDFKQMTII